jgi:hypothetical protein
MSTSALPPRCPSCNGKLRVVMLQCPACEAEVSGSFDGCPVCALEGEQRRILDLFLAARGNLKQVQKELGVSYPTTRQRVEAMFAKLEGKPEPAEPTEILGRLAAGEIDVDEAERLLRAGD